MESVLDQIMEHRIQFISIAPVQLFTLLGSVFCLTIDFIVSDVSILLIC